MLQVAKPVESIKQCKCGWKDNSWDFVNLRDRIKSLFGIVHGTSDASFALAFIPLRIALIMLVFSIVPFPTFGPVDDPSFRWVIWRLARRCSVKIYTHKVWLTPSVKAFKKCRENATEEIHLQLLLHLPNVNKCSTTLQQRWSSKSLKKESLFLNVKENWAHFLSMPLTHLITKRYIFSSNSFWV